MHHVTGWGGSEPRPANKRPWREQRNSIKEERNNDLLETRGKRQAFSKFNQATSFVIESSAMCVAGMQHAWSIFGEILDAKLFGHRMSRCWLAERTMLLTCAPADSSA